jgi:peptide/nickel transport system substrate-binding protein
MLVQSGEVDFAEKIISEDWATLNATEGVLLTVQAKGLYPNPICFDMTEAPFNDSRVRLAVAYAMDYDKLLQVLPYSSRVYQFLPVPQYGTAPNITQYSMNITKAKELMTAAGYGNLLQGQTMHLVCVGFDARPDQKKMYEVLKASILAIGFDLEIKMLTGSLALASWTQTQNWDIACNRCGAFVDPDTLAQYTNSTSGLFNVPHYNNSRVDYLETLARATGDMATRLTYYYEVETILSNEIPWLPMMDYPMVSCQRAWLKNAQFRGLYTYCPINIYEVWKQK